MTQSPAQTKMPLRLILSGLGAAILLVATVLTGLYLGRETQSRFQDIAQSWQAYSVTAQTRGELLSRIRKHLGYGGIIHNFKNYVLRQDDQYLESFQAQLLEFDDTLREYCAQGASPEEIRLLAEIARTIEEYAGMSEIAIQAAAENWPPTRTDRLVKVDDTAATAALAGLEEYWRAQDISTTRAIVGAVDEGRKLVNAGFSFLGGLALVAVLVYGLFFLLQKELRETIGRLSQELAERRAAELAAKKFQRAVDQSPATIIITDTDSSIEYVNRKFCELTGYESAEMIGRTPRILQSGDVSAERYTALRQQLARGEEWQGTFRNVKKNGEAYWAKTVILPLRDDEGRITNYIGLGEDITDRKRAREQMQRAQKIEAVSMLASGVAHDFNNVLTTILGNVHIIKADTDAASPIAEEIDHIEIAAKRARNLVGQIFAFARRQPGEAVAVDVEGVLAEVSHLLRASIQPNITLDFEVDEPGLHVHADPNRLYQVIMNLCSNAAEAIGPKGGHIDVSAQRLAGDNGSNGRIAITVSDDGPGMAEEVRRRVFDPFFTTKPVGKGTGLGLSIVSNLVAEMNGMIDVSSEPGKGCMFVVTLPEVEADKPAYAAGATPQRGEGTVLLIDDEPEVATTCAKLLRRLGYRVEMFTDPKEAMNRFAEAPGLFDAVVTDLLMPDIDGFEVARQVAEKDSACPVIVCSAYDPETLNLGDGHFSQYLAKPIEPERLSLAVSEVMKKAALETNRHTSS